MGNQHSCDCFSDIPEGTMRTGKGKKRRRRRKGKKGEPNERSGEGTDIKITVQSAEEEGEKNEDGFYKGAIVEAVSKMRVGKADGDKVVVPVGMRLRVIKLKGKQKQKLLVVSEQEGGLPRALTLGPGQYKYLKLVAAGEADEGVEEVSFTETAQPLERVVSGWYEARQRLVISMSDDSLMEAGGEMTPQSPQKRGGQEDIIIRPGDLVHIVETRDVGNQKQGRIAGEKEHWVTIQDENTVSLAFAQNRVKEIQLEGTTTNSWGAATNFPSEHQNFTFEVTRIQEGEQLHNLGVRLGWKIVGVDELTTCMDASICETQIATGQACIVYFDTKVRKNLAVKPAASHLSVLSEKANSLAPSDMDQTFVSFSQDHKSTIRSDKPEIKFREPESWSISQFLCAISGFLSLGLVGMMVYFHEVFSWKDFTNLLVDNEGPDNMSTCHDFPMIITVWCLIIISIALLSLPAQCEGCCARFYGYGVWCAVLFGIWPMVEFFTLSSTCKNNIKNNHNDLWIAYQIFIWSQIGLSSCALIYSVLYAVESRSQPEEPPSYEDVTSMHEEKRESVSIELQVSPV